MLLVAAPFLGRAGLFLEEAVPCLEEPGPFLGEELGFFLGDGVRFLDAWDNDFFFKAILSSN